MKILKIFLKLFIAVFALVGFVLSAAYAAVNLHLTDTKGIVDEQTESFWKASAAASLAVAQESLVAESPDSGRGAGDFFNKQNYCSLKAVKNGYPAEFTRIYDMAVAGSLDLAQKNLDYLMLALNKKDVSYAAYRSCANDLAFMDISRQDFEILAGVIDLKSPLPWVDTEEWEFFKEGVLKDKSILERIEKETGISQRVLVSELMAEQMRLFYSDRPAFKKIISPLKVLGSMTQFSWGLFGIKPETAMKIEENLRNQASSFYPGQAYARMLDFKTKNIQHERFVRITDSRDHYYAYLYAALYNKEIISQWERAGIDISRRPEILATLFNIGFAHSIPNDDPKTGGARLDIENSVYSFGGLAAEFYYSGQLIDDFPQKPLDDSAAALLADGARDIVISSPKGLAAPLSGPAMVLDQPGMHEIDQWLQAAQAPGVATSADGLSATTTQFQDSLPPSF